MGTSVQTRGPAVTKGSETAGQTTPRIVLGVNGRFHTFDVAEALRARGALARIFTNYPKFKLRNTQIPPEEIGSFPWLKTPYMYLLRYPWFRGPVKREIDYASKLTLDSYMARNLPDCDMLSVLSSSGLKAGREAKRRGIAYVCDRGSSHIVYQDTVLAEEFARVGRPYTPTDRRIIDREMQEYDLADAITVPSRFVYRSFLEMGVPEEKLRLIPYGVNLANFSRKCPRDKTFRVLFVGAQSVRKGVHYLVEAFNKAELSDAKLVFVGASTPDSQVLLKQIDPQRTEFTGVVSRERVAEEMSRASVLALPSLEEGLATVQAQALSCECPVIGTFNSGAETLFEDGKEGFIVPIRDADAVAERLRRLYEDRDLVETLGAAGRRRMESVGGWGDYGDALIDLARDLTSGRVTCPS